jgi:hypothetical protein
VVITKDANGKLMARVVEVTKAGHGITITQMPLNLDPNKAKDADGNYKTTLTQADMLPPNKGESVRLFTYAFNSQGEPEGNVIMTPSPQGLPKTFNELPGVVKAKITASSYADPVTFPPTSKLTMEQTNIASTYNSDLALLEGASVPPVTSRVAPQQAPVQQQAPVPAAPQQPQPQQPLIFPAPQVQQPAQSIQQPIAANTTTTPATTPAQTVVTTPTPATPTVAPRRVLIQPDWLDITNQQTKALGWE